MNEIVVEEKESIESMIYEVRGVQVMLDSDLAKLYECKNGTKGVIIIDNYAGKELLDMLKVINIKIIHSRFIN